MRIVKRIKTLLIVSLSVVIAACSSGGSGSTEGVNITGPWIGILNQTTGLAYDVQVDFAQFDTVGVPGNPQSTAVTFSISILRLNDVFGEVDDVCTGATLAGEGLTLNAAANPATLVGDGFNAVVIDNMITGQIVVDDFDSVPVEVTDPDTGETTTVDVECAFGGPLNLTRL